MKIQVRKSYFGGQIFEDETLYLAHLKETKESNREKWKLVWINRKFKNWLENEKLKVTHYSMIGPWFLENQVHIISAYRSGITSKSCSRFFNDKAFPTDKFTSLRLSGYWTPALSNSHTCPDNGVTNWCNTDRSKPTSYPGWGGRIELSITRDGNHNSSFPVSAILGLIGIKTGGGGISGVHNWAYDASVFLDDWPGLETEVREMEAEQIMYRLKNRVIA